MKLSEIFERKKTTVSFEVFPPKPNLPFDSVFECIGELCSYHPDYMSVTYGAGGSTRGRTFDLAQMIKTKYHVEPLVHITGVKLDEAQLDELLNDIEIRGLENILALRGDVPQDGTIADLRFHASDIVKIIKKRGDRFFVAVAACPEMHPESKTLEDDLKYIKLKLDCGAGLIVTQMCFDNDLICRFRDRLHAIGVTQPIDVGIMPVFAAKQVGRISSMCGATIPAGLIAIMEKYGSDAEAMEQAGIQFAADQVTGLIEEGFHGIHIYTMNRPKLAKGILDLTGLLAR